MKTNKYKANSVLWISILLIGLSFCLLMYTISAVQLNPLNSFKVIKLSNGLCGMMIMAVTLLSTILSDSLFKKTEFLHNNIKHKISANVGVSAFFISMSIFLYLF